MKVGMAQILVEGGEPQRNFDRAFKYIDQAKVEGCDLVLLPETIDFAWTHPRSIEHAQPIPGPFSELFCQKAKELEIYICLGLTERVSETKRYNTAILINDKGEIILKHHKINLLEVEFPFYEVGNTLNVVNTPFGKIGLNVCADNYLESLNIGHTLAQMGAQIILSPSSWTVGYNITELDNPYENKWIRPLSVLSSIHELVILNTTSVGYIVGGPYEGKKMVGCSLAVDKDGVLAEGEFNEFAGDMKVVEFNVSKRKFKGTQIGEQLKNEGVKFY